jgi:hypothetical protein
MQLGDDPWVELLWNPAAGRMITAPENQEVAFQILYYGMDGDLWDINKSASDVRREWAGIVNRSEKEVKLRRWSRS